MPKSNLPHATSSFLRNLRSQYLESGELHSLIEREGFSILNDFLNNWDVIEQFYAQYYGHGFPTTVLCGLNPGRLGAGKTGIPFLDFASLSNLLDGVSRKDTERSATFFHDIVSHFGADPFYRSFFVTNVSWVGFAKSKKNVNYNKLPTKAQDFVFERLREEIQLVNPIRIISIGKQVHDTIQSLFDGRFDTSLWLPHPNWCAFPKKYKSSKAKYVKTLTQFVKS